MRKHGTGQRVASTFFSPSPSTRHARGIACSDHLSQSKIVLLIKVIFLTRQANWLFSRSKSENAVGNRLEILNEKTQAVSRFTLPLSVARFRLEAREFRQPISLLLSVKGPVSIKQLGAQRAALPIE
jgi:hypothetical protein